MEKSNTAGEPLSGLAASADRAGGVESAYAWLRLAAALAISTIGTVGMWSGVVALPALQAEFGVARADASLPYTLTMIAFGFGGIMMGRFADRFGVVVPVVGGTIMLALGYALAAAAPNLWLFTLAQALLIGLLGSSAMFAPLVADTSGCNGADGGAWQQPAGEIEDLALAVLGGFAL